PSRGPTARAGRRAGTSAGSGPWASRRRARRRGSARRWWSSLHQLLVVAERLVVGAEERLEFRLDLAAGDLERDPLVVAGDADVVELVILQDPHVGLEGVQDVELLRVPRSARWLVPARLVAVADAGLP